MEEFESQYLECYNNKVAQLFALFLAFLYTAMYDSKENQMLHNIFADCRRIYTRAILDFFSNNKKGDDLNYKDFIHTEVNFEIFGAEHIRTLANKQTAHFTKSRGTFGNTTNEYKYVAKQLIKKISCFMQELDRNITENYLQEYKDESVQELRKVVLAQLCKIYILNMEGSNLEGGSML